MNESIHGEGAASESEDRVAELIEQQTAISGVLRAIASSPHDLQPIFDAILDGATRLCRADLGSLRLSEKGGLRRVSVRGEPLLVSQAWSSYPVLEEKESFLSQLAPSGLPTHMLDLRELEGAGRDEFLVSKVNAGLRTGLVVRLLSEGGADDVIQYVYNPVGQQVEEDWLSGSGNIIHSTQTFYDAAGQVAVFGQM